MDCHKAVSDSSPLLKTFRRIFNTFSRLIPILRHKIIFNLISEADRLKLLLLRFQRITAQGIYSPALFLCIE